MQQASPHPEPQAAPTQTATSRTARPPRRRGMPMHARTGGLRFLENLAYLVPGCHGYRQHDLRRQEDSKLRARVCRQIDSLVMEIDSLLAHAGGAPDALATGLREGRRRLTRSADQVRLAPGELERFFEAARISEVTLERTLEADLLIFQDLEDAQAQIDRGRHLSTGPRTVRGFVRGLDQILHHLEEHLIMRERVLAGG